jgi:hypothetical protein
VFGYETLRPVEDGAQGEAGLNGLGSLLAAVLVAPLGFRLAVALWAGLYGPGWAGPLGRPGRPRT